MHFNPGIRPNEGRLFVALLIVLQGVLRQGAEMEYDVSSTPLTNLLRCVRRLGCFVAASDRTFARGAPKRSDYAGQQTGKMWSREINHKPK